MIRSLPRTTEEKRKFADNLCRQAVEIDDEFPEEGMRLYQRAIQIDPDCELALSNLGRLYYLYRDDSDGAEIWWLRALDVNPDYVEANYNLGYLRLEQGMYTAAIDLFEKALASDERFEDAHFHLAAALQEIDETDEARVHWRRYVQLGGEFKNVAMMHLGLRVIEGG